VLSLFSFDIKIRIAEIVHDPYNARWRTLGKILNGSRQCRAYRSIFLVAVGSTATISACVWLPLS